MTWHGIDVSDVKEMDFTDSEVENFRLRRGDLLLNEASGSAAEVGKPAVWNDEIPDCCFQNTLIRVRAPEEIVPFLLWRFRYDAIFGHFADASRGIGIHHLGREAVDAWEIEIPPLPEQRRIVAKLDALQARTRRARQGLDELAGLADRLRSALLAAAFRGDLTAAWRAEHPDVEPASALLGRIRAERRRRWEEANPRKRYVEPEPLDPEGLPKVPEGWGWATLDTVLTELRNGIAVKPDSETGTPILRISAVRPLSVNLNDVRYLEPDPEYERFLLAKGDLLFTRYSGNADLVGSCGVVEGDPRGRVYPDKLMRVRLVPMTSPWFVAASVSMGAGRSFVDSCTKTAAGQVGISGADVRKTPVPITSEAEQSEIVRLLRASLAAADHLVAAVAARRSDLDALDRALLDRAFRGELSTGP